MNGTEAAAASSEILELVKELKEEYKHENKALEALEKVRIKAQEIKDAGDSGWY